MKCSYLIVWVVLLSPLSAPRQLVELGLDAMPIDLAVTPGGEVGAVRATSDSSLTHWITFYNLLSGVQVPAQGPPAGCPTTVPWGGHEAGTAISDLIVGDNAFFAAIGGTKELAPNPPAPLGGQNRTYVDFFRIDYGTGEPPVITMHCQANHIFEDNTSQFTQTGNAHDIAMSPNGSRVVVNHRNWIHVFNARGTMLAAFNVGSSAPALQPTDPLLAVDSIAITDSRAVVVTNRQGVYTWVYVIDLLVNPPVIVRDEQIGGSVANQHSHDVAVSPNGNRAVVTANGALAIFDLQINQLVFEQEDSSLFREFATLKDSVEMSDTRAVVLSDSNESGVLAVEGPSL